MRSRRGKDFLMVKKEDNGFTVSKSLSRCNSTSQEPIEVSSSSEEDEYQSCENAQNQLVVYSPTSIGSSEIVPVPEPIDCQPSPLQRYTNPNLPSRVLPSVGAFTVQCANCFKWRLIPSKEKYEEIREHILEQPFFCKAATAWRADISCDDPADISQDGSRLWAIDKPNIAQPPSGWERLLRIRGEGSTKFADVYYVSPSGKRLRSMVEIQKYLMENPEYTGAGVSISQFSFQIPRPLQENYVRKRPVRLTAPPIEPGEARPLAWAGPDDNSTDLQLGTPGLSTSPEFFDSGDRLAGKPTKRRRSSLASTSPIYS